MRISDWSSDVCSPDLVSETGAARTSRVVLDEGQYLTAPGEQLAGQLMEFGVDARSNEVVVAYQAMLVSAGGKTVTQRRFEVREPIGGEVEAKPVGEALTRAANRVAVDVADWRSDARRVGEGVGGSCRF